MLYNIKLLKGRYINTDFKITEQRFSVPKIKFLRALIGKFYTFRSDPDQNFFGSCSDPQHWLLDCCILDGRLLSGICMLTPKK